MINNVYELFSLDGEEFVIAAYRNILSREPDKHGLAYYLGRLALGYEKEDVVVQLAQSPECERLDKIDGLKGLVAKKKRSTFWIIKIFRGGRQRFERKLIGTLMPLMYIEQHLHSLQDAMLLIAQQQQKEDRYLKRICDSEVKQKNESPRLSSEIVRQCFVDILGREPESEEVIKMYTFFESKESISDVLLNSDEYKQKILSLPEFARIILMRQIQMKALNKESIPCGW